MSKYVIAKIIKKIFVLKISYVYKIKTIKYFNLLQTNKYITKINFCVINCEINMLLK